MIKWPPWNRQIPPLEPVRPYSTVDDDYDPEDYETEGVCKYCGVRYDPKARFCSRCGAPYPGGELDYWRTEDVRITERQDTVRMLMTTNVYLMDSDGGTMLAVGDTDYYRMGDSRLTTSD